MSAAHIGSQGTVSNADIVDHIHQHGCYILKDAIEPGLCDALCEEIDRLEDEQVPRSLDNDFHGHQTTRFYDVLNLGDVWQQLPPRTRRALLEHPDYYGYRQELLDFLEDYEHGAHKREAA
ncbi:MAG: hypothetical protein AAF525_06800, partial [Pseudomonadota bacterium]